MKKSNSFGKSVAVILIGIAVIIGILFMYSYATMALWNWIMVSIFSLPHIDIWQAFGIYLLSIMLFHRAAYNVKK